jgi:hypothetical protein
LTKKTIPPRLNHAAAPAHGFDGAGHMDPAHAARLLELARLNRDDEPAAFISGVSTSDDLAERLAEASVESMTSGESQLGPDLEAVVEEERGGPFVETSGRTEFADGTDASNIATATREPFPTS